jgi:hypothetical protein
MTDGSKDEGSICLRGHGSVYVGFLGISEYSDIGEIDKPAGGAPVRSGTGAAFGTRSSR